MQGGARELQHGGVVERRADQMDVAVERLDAEDAEEAAEVALLGKLAGQRPADAARAAGGAGGVVHDPAQRAPFRGRHRPVLQQFGVRAEAVDRTDSVTVARGQFRLVRGGGGGFGEAFVGDEHLGAGVGDDPGDLRADEVVVDGDEVEPGL